MLRVVVSSVLALGLGLGAAVGAPLAAEAAPAEGSQTQAAPTDILDPLFNPILRAFDLQSYRISNMPPTKADIIRWNPEASPDEVDQMLKSSKDSFYYQRQKRVLAENPRASITDAPSTPAEVKAAALDQKKWYKRKIFKPAPLVKKFMKGGVQVAVAVTGFEFGVGIGNGIMQSFGVDVDGLVCTQDNASLLGEVTGADCANWLANQPQFTPDEDAGGMTAGKVCDTSGKCITLVSFAASPDGQGTPSLIFTTENITASPVNIGLSFDCGGTVCHAGMSAWMYKTPIPYKGCAGVAAGVYCTPSSFNYTDITGPWCYSIGNSGSCTATSPKLVTFEDPAPDRTLSCQIQGDNGQTYSQSTQAFKEADGKLPVPDCPELPAGVQPVNAKVIENGGKEPLELYNQPRLPEAAEFADQYPQCLDGGCTLELKQVESGESCFDLGETCDGWFTDPQKSSKYSCSYAEEPVELERCNLYRQTFDPQFREKGFAYSNPYTGQVQLTPTAPSAKEAALSQPASFDSCMNESIADVGFWMVIFSPVRCAIVWAFVPDPLTITATGADLVDSFLATPLGQVSAILGSWNPAVALDGCEGPPIELHVPLGFGDAMLFDYSGHPVDACPGTMLAGFVEPTRTFGTALMIIFGAFTIINMVAGVIGYRSFVGPGDGN